MRLSSLWAPAEALAILYMNSDSGKGADHMSELWADLVSGLWG